MTADVTSFLRRSARVAPLGVAVASPDGEQTYAELLAQVDELARSLPPSDQGPEPIAVVTGNDPITPCLYLAVIAAGHAVVPLSSRLPHHVIARIAETAGIRLGLLWAHSTPPQTTLGGSFMVGTHETLLYLQSGQRFLPGRQWCRSQAERPANPRA